MQAAATILAHDGGLLLPHDALAAWSFDPPIVAALGIAGWLYWRGWNPRRDSTAHGGAMLGGLVIVAVALLSPIDAVAAILLSGHMVQHVLLIAVAAPLVAWAGPGAAMLRGTPAPIRRRFVAIRRSSGLTPTVVARLRHPAGRWLLLVATTWIWHSAMLYSRAVDNDIVHAVEHVTFLAAAIGFWTVVVGPRRASMSPGLAILAVFTLMLQGIVLSMLMTFSPIVWYEPYADVAAGWGLDPLADQQLAGVIMWIPTGFIHAGITLALLLRWLRAIDEPPPASERRGDSGTDSGTDLGAGDHDADSHRSPA